MSNDKDKLLAQITATIDEVLSKPLPLSLKDTILLLICRRIISKTIAETQKEIERVKLAKEERWLNNIGTGLN